MDERGRVGDHLCDVCDALNDSNVSSLQRLCNIVNEQKKTIIIIQEHLVLTYKILTHKKYYSDEAWNYYAGVLKFGA